jgi:hypothetical protein
MTEMPINNTGSSSVSCLAPYSLLTALNSFYHLFQTYPSKEGKSMAAKGKFPLKGGTLPLTPKGRSSVIDPPLWHYGVDIPAIMTD